MFQFSNRCANSDVQGPTQEEPVKVENQEAILETVYTTQEHTKNN